MAMDKAAPDPSRAAVFSSDMIAGFLSTGNLASGRTGLLAKPVTEVFRKAHRRGIRHFVLFQDTHDPDAPEFSAFPTHCIGGSAESATIPELMALPFSDVFTIIEKNSLDAALGTDFDQWLDAHEHINRALVVGNCTDLCVYQLAMHVRLWANAATIAIMRSSCRPMPWIPMTSRRMTPGGSAPFRIPAISFTGCFCTTWPSTGYKS